MTLEERKFLNKLRKLSLMGDNSSIISIVEKKLKEYSKIKTILKIKYLIDIKDYNKALDFISFQLDIYPDDFELYKLETECLLKSCCENG